MFSRQKMIVHQSIFKTLWRLKNCPNFYIIDLFGARKKKPVKKNCIKCLKKYKATDKKRLKRDLRAWHAFLPCAHCLAWARGSLAGCLCSFPQQGPCWMIHWKLSFYDDWRALRPAQLHIYRQGRLLQHGCHR